jgi:hypothetical protein
MLRRLLPLTGLALALALPAPALAIVGGEEVDEGEFPAQAFITVDGGPNPDRFCGGTLVGSRQVLTSARCATLPVFGTPSSEASFTVRLGDADLTQTPADEYGVADNDVYGGSFDAATDVAMLTLDRPAPAALTPERVVDAGETAAWTPGTTATVLGWGETEAGGVPSLRLRSGFVTVRDDEDCVDEATVLCASAASAGNPCAGDAGSPLLVPDGALLALAGVFSGLPTAGTCTSDAQPAQFARIGAEPLNGWVHDRTPQANFDLSHQPRATEPVTLTSTSTYPPPGTAGDDFFDTVRWDLDGDGQFDDRTGKQIAHAFPSAGTAIVGIEASNKAEGDRASAYFSFPVEAAPGGGTTTTTPPPPATPLAVTPVAGPLATILVSGRPKVRNRRFPIRIRFARTAPAGTAVIEVYRGKRRIGIARTRVRRGATQRVRVRLTPQGRRMLRRADSKRLRIRVRVRVGRDVLRTKRITIRR